MRARPILETARAALMALAGAAIALLFFAGASPTITIPNFAFAVIAVCALISAALQSWLALLHWRLSRARRAMIKGGFISASEAKAASGADE